MEEWSLVLQRVLLSHHLPVFSSLCLLDYSFSYFISPPLCPDIFWVASTSLFPFGITWKIRYWSDSNQVLSATNVNVNCHFFYNFFSNNFLITLHHWKYRYSQNEGNLREKTQSWRLLLLGVSKLGRGRLGTPGQSARIGSKTPMQFEILHADMTFHEIFLCNTVGRSIVGYTMTNMTTEYRSDSAHYTLHSA